MVISPTRISEFDVVVKDSINKALREAVELLYSLGHRRIAYIGEPLVEEKRNMLSSELYRIGIEDCDGLLYSSILRFEAAGVDGVEKLFSEKEKAPTAVIGAYGYITQGIISALKDMGYSLPQDVAVISMDNVPAPLSFDIDVAHISYDMERACTEALSLLKARMGKDAPKTAQITEICATFYRGESISAISHGDL